MNKQIRKTLLEFFARFVMNTFKLIIGLSLGIGFVVANYKVVISPAIMASSQSMMLALVILSACISAIETKQDWEFVPAPKAASDEAPANS
jgi:hypothetical protein